LAVARRVAHEVWHHAGDMLANRAPPTAPTAPTTPAESRGDERP
jgi:hypothetical protein